MTVPLQLDNYFFPIVSVIANPDYRPEVAEGKGAPILDVAVSVKEHEKNVYEVQLDVKISNTDENPSPYEVFLKGIGVFTIDPRVPDPEVMVKSAGASILYSASREFLLSVMSRGPWAPVMLNLQSFRPTPSPQMQEPVTP